MYLKKATVSDYSTGSSYSYGDKSGSWKSITAEGGKVQGNTSDAPKSAESAPPVTATVSEPVPWDGTHKQTSSYATPSEWPWVPNSIISTTAKSTSVPPGWSSGSEQVPRPSATSVSEHSLVPFCSPFLFANLVIFSPTCRWVGLLLPRLLIPLLGVNQHPPACRPLLLLRLCSHPRLLSLSNQPQQHLTVLQL